MAPHFTPRTRKQCSWCGNSAPFREECPINYEIRHAIACFAAAMGRNWKSQLDNSYQAGDFINAELQTYRNVAGPSMLKKITPGMLSHVLSKSH